MMWHALVLQALMRNSLQIERYNLLDKLEPYPLKVRLSEQASIFDSLTHAELNMRIDLRPFMQRTPFIIQVHLPSCRARIIE